jgi:8-hydroxy-5-deazaflavin:NADPH oxidoreductase
MKVGIIGSGVVGKQLGIGFLRLGHEVKIGTRDTSKLNDWLKQAGSKVSVGSFKDAAVFGEFIVIATFWAGTGNAINLAGKENFNGKVVIDVTNPLDFSSGFPPKFGATVGNSAGEHIQKMLPGAKVVKAFNIVNAYVMIDPKREEGDPDLFIAGNDQASKDKVKSIAEQWGWKSVIDIGDISQALFLEALTQIWISYAAKTNQFGHAFKLLKK